MAILVIGSGLGEVKKNPLFPSCALKGIDHEDFYKECHEPACYFVAKDYGHIDMLDDETKGIRGKTSYCLCKNGKSREPMRRFVGGIMVAFMKAYLEGGSSCLLELGDGDLANLSMKLDGKKLVCRIIEECESRLGDSVEELVELVAEVLLAPPTQTETDDAGFEDKQEIPDGQQMDTS
ncbi:hypothetical protein TEA_024315 [Camellia sinensis var. sinensis]|uniref:Chlorophyllase n=1 Tax=Camellia sinensis var. sinensis TaxID=542762 RepID=A0A4S4E1K3_CAMSN|nr:hypothetical protein TEA_024315 [Camellia sinensis var. sinensis]